METMPQPAPMTNPSPPPDRANEPATMPAEDSGRTTNRPMVAGLLAATVVVVALLAGVTTDWFGLRSTENPRLLFGIPAGTAETLERPSIDSAIAIPTKIRFGPDDAAVITIRTEDTVAYRAVPFVIDAGQTFVQRFPDPGEYPIACSVDPAESVVITVEA